jgi:small-conductance mechanosensitive channel
MNFRNTHVRTFDGQDIFVPNAMLIKNPLSNYTRDGLLRYQYTLGIDYGDDIALAMKTVLDKLWSLHELEQTPGLRPFIMIDSFGTSTVNLAIYFWVNTFRHKPNADVVTIRNKAMAAGVEALTKSGFSLPADIIELKIYQEGQPIPVKMVD